VNIGFMQGRLSPIERGRLQTFPFHNWEKEFQIASKNNFSLIEWTIDTYKINNNPILNEEGVKKIKSNLDKFSIKVESVTCDFFMENPLFNKNKNKIDSIDYVIKLLNNCKFLGVKYIVLPIVDFSSIKNKFDEIKLINEINSLSNIIPEGTKILFETDFSPVHNLSFINKFDKSKFGLNYDTGNSASLGYNFDEEMINFYDYIDNVHIKDRKFNSHSVDLGLGSFLFKNFFLFLSKKKYKGNLILQTARSKSGKHLELLLKNKLFIENITNAIKS
jgi:L-ribulose-5-phosphate 3-epimerase